MKEITESVSPRSLLRLVIGVAGVVVILAGLQAAAGIVNLVLLAFLITMLTLPLMNRLRARGVSHAASFVLVLLLILAVALGVLLMAGIALANSVSGESSYLASFQAQTARLAQQSGIPAQPYVDSANAGASAVLSVLVRVAANSIELLVNGAFLLIITAFMLVEAETFGALVRRTVGADNPTYQRVAASTSAVMTYIRITAIINFAIAVGDVILLTLVGVPNAIFWGIISFVFGFIPYIGYWISFLPPFIIAFGMGGLSSALVVLVGYALINGVVSQIVAPRMYGQGLNMSITLTIVAVLFWGWLLGPVGGMLAVPLTAIIKSALLASYSETEWLAKILSNSRAVDESSIKLAPGSKEQVPGSK